MALWSRKNEKVLRLTRQERKELRARAREDAELAARIHVSYPRVNELVHGKRGVTPDTALRLSRLLGTSPEFWLNLQLAHDLWQAMHAESARTPSDIRPVA